VNVLELGLTVTAPLACKILGMFGATVVKVEGPPDTLRFDPLRMYPPFFEGSAGVNRSGAFADYNGSTLSATIDAGNPSGMELIKKLVVWCDVLVENFSAGTLKRMGLDYDELVRLNPGIILAMSATAGETGPAATQPGTGLQLQSTSGFTYILGWPDRPPVGSPNAYTDYIGPWYLVVAIIAALEQRMRTGKGQWIDMSQLEAAVTFLTPVALDFAANGRVLNAQGNKRPNAAPHGAYQCKGDDRWCVIAVSTDDEWRTFCRIIGNPDLVRDPRFETLSARKEHEDELNTFVQEWTKDRTPEEAVGSLQAAGIAAGVVLNGRELHEDPQLQTRSYFQTTEHPEMGIIHGGTGGYVLSKTPPFLGPPPCLGEHTDYICREILGLSDEEFVELLNEGVFGTL
jgi:benzylsuccinate CoA-transferase BbsF subunit